MASLMAIHRKNSSGPQANVSSSGDEKASNIANQAAVDAHTVAGTPMNSQRNPDSFLNMVNPIRVKDPDERVVSLMLSL